MDSVCPCPAGRILWLILPPGMRERLEGMGEDERDRELEELAGLLAG